MHGEAVLQPNFIWSADSAFDYLGSGTSNNSTTPALMLVFSSTSNGNGTGLNNLTRRAEVRPVKNARAKVRREQNARAQIRP
jgi:hypothetical protein